MRSALKNNNDGLVEIMNDYASRPENMFLKLGDRGFIIINMIEKAIY